ncbi:MAG TPA: FAD-binding oxidoreductase [Anaerolineae bacterium]|nr:FAD-binding oxidoreductase [Anaerolineae bacterium]
MDTFSVTTEQMAQYDTFVDLNEHRIHAFEARLQGELIRPGDAAYDEARAVWNGMIDRYPALIARCATVTDVVASVNFARQNNLVLAVRGGGHNAAGHATCDGGLVIDLSPLKQISVDSTRQIVRVGGGATIADLDAATQPHGLVVPMGVVSQTGIAGLTLGGGFGWLRNKYGLSCDNLIAAEVVTAEGRVIRASETENRDLLWGLRGGGGNFGIVTTFEFRAYPLGPDVAFTFIAYSGEGEQMKKSIEYYRDYVSTAPDEVSVLWACGMVPAGHPVFPVEAHGRSFVLFGAMYAGPAEEGQRVMQPLRDFGQPVLDFSGVMPYVQAQKVFDADYPRGWRRYWKSLNLNGLADAAIERIVSHARRQVSPFSTIALWHIGGAVKRGGANESAFNGRQAAHLLSPEANWTDPAADEANISWLRSLSADMEEFSDGSRYLNFPGFQEEGDEMMRQSFGNQYSRLAALKQKYDPTNFFSLNQNIKPSA